MAVAVALFTVAFLFLAPGILPKGEAFTPAYTITLTVYNSLTNKPNTTYTTGVAFRAPLLGAMKRARDSNKNFRFTTTDNIDYGPYLESINGVKGSTAKKTYWQILIEHNGVTIPADVGVGCVIPSEGDNVIFKFTSY